MVKKETVVICLRCFSHFLRHGVGLPGLSNASGLEEVYNVTGLMLFLSLVEKQSAAAEWTAFHSLL